MWMLLCVCVCVSKKERYLKLNWYFKHLKLILKFLTRTYDLWNEKKWEDAKILLLNS